MGSAALQGWLLNCQNIMAFGIASEKSLTIFAILLKGGGHSNVRQTCLLGHIKVLKHLLRGTHVGVVHVGFPGIIEANKKKKFLGPGRREGWHKSCTTATASLGLAHKIHDSWRSSVIITSENQDEAKVGRINKGRSSSAVQ